MFDLTEECIRQIIFAVENQKTRYAVATETGTVFREDRVPETLRPEPGEIDPEAEYISLPQWTSADGFQLMESFTAHVRNPVVQDELRTVLSGGTGVFRGFKNILGAHPEIERRWHRFKFRVMRSRITDWYNMHREVFGLEAVEQGADEELDDLALQSFQIEVLSLPPETLLLELDRNAYSEARSGIAAGLVSHLYRESRLHLPSLSDPRSIIWGAVTPMNDLSGFLWAVCSTTAEGAQIISLEQIYVVPEFRGLGIGSSMVDRFYRAYREGEYAWALLNPGVACDHFRRRISDFGARRCGCMDVIDR